MRTVDESEGMGILQPVLDAEARRGNRATVTIGANLVRGNPPQARLGGHLERRRVEDQFELGTLVRWIPPTSRGGSWTLVDTATGTSVSGSGWTPFGAVAARLRRGAPAGRTRLGWVADDPRLASADASTRSCRVTTSDPAASVLSRIEDLLGSSDTPDWFARRCAPARDHDAWLSAGREIGRLAPAEQRIALWESRWSVAEWRRTREPREQTWQWAGAQVLDEHTLDVTLSVVARWAPIDSAKWMLRAAGVVDRVVV